MEETVIFNVDTSEYEAALARINKDITTLRENQKLYQQQTKEGVAGAAEAYERVSAELKIQQQAYRTTQAVLVGYNATQKQAIDLVKLENNSIQQNRDLLKQLTAQIINTRNPSEKFKQQVKDVSEALKKQEAALGDNRRNVGNYAEGFKSALSQIGNAVPVLGSVIDPLKNMSAGFKDAGGGIQGLSAAFSSGILVVVPLIVTAFNYLTDALKSFKPIADEVEKVTAAIGAGFSALIRGGDIAEAAKQAYELTGALQDLEDAQNALIISNSQYDSQIKQLLVSLRNKNLTEQEGRKILDELKTIERERFEQNSQLAKEELRIAREQFLNKTGLYSAELDALIERGRVKSQLDEQEIQSIMKSGDLTRQQVLDIIASQKAQQQALAESAEKKASIDDKEIKRITELTARVNQIKGESAVLNEQIKNREDAFNDRIESERLKKEEQRKRAYEKLRSDELRSIEDTLKKQAEDEAKFFEEQTERELDALVRQEQITARRVGSVEAAINAELVARNRALQNEKLTSTERENILRESEGRISEIRRRAAEEAQRISDEELKNYKRNQQAVVDSVSQISNAIVNILGLASQLINQLADQNVQALNEQYEQGTLKQAEFEQQTKEIKLKAWKQSKDIALTQAVMNTANAVMAQLSNPTPYVGIVLAALAAATGAIQIGLIASQKPPKFAKGGKVIDIDGKSHSQGGTPIHVNGQYVAEAEKDEGLFIMKKNAYSELKKLSDWNQSFGGNSWGVKTTFAAMGGSISDGGFTTREIITQVNDTNSLKTAVIEGVRSMPNPVVSVQEINRVNTVRNKSVAVSELG